MSRSVSHRAATAARLLLLVPILLLVGSLASPSLLAQARGPAWVRTGGPLGGLGYDIRFDFDEPNTWYVTDSYAGVHRSTDRGATWLPSNTDIPPQAGLTGDGIPIFSLTVDPHDPQILWAGTNVTGHIYRSGDGGDTWEQRDTGVTIKYGSLTFRGFTVDPRSSEIVYAMGETSDPITGQAVWGPGTGGVIYKTTDGGRHWTEIWDGGMPSSLARYLWIPPEKPNVLFVSTGIFDRGAVGEGDWATDPFGGLGILRSMDGGVTWETLDEDNGLEMLYIGSLYMHPEDPDILLAAAGHVVPTVYVDHLQQTGELSPAGIYRTEDGGDTWEKVIQPPQQRPGEIFTSVELCPSSPNDGYAGSDLAMYRTRDGGLTWKMVAGPKGWGPPGVTVGWPIDMQCDPANPERVFSNNYAGGNFLSEDGGRTWKNASTGYTGVTVLGLAEDPFAPGRVYAAGRSGIWRSDDAGGHWEGIFYPASHEPAPLGLDWTAVAADPHRPGHVLGGHGFLLETTDRGALWHTRFWVGGSGELPGGVLTSIAFAPGDCTTVYAALGGWDCMLRHERNDARCSLPGPGVLRSDDGGTTWARAVGGALGNANTLDVAVDPDDARTAYAATTRGLFKTTNGGEVWAQLPALPANTMARAVAVNPKMRGHVLVGLEGLGVYRSTDGGLTWQAAIAGLEPNGSLHDILFNPVNPRVVYASDARSGVYRSTDGGVSWARINDGLRNRSARGLAISRDGLHLYAATDGEGVFRLDFNGVPPRPGPGDRPASPPCPR